MVFLESVTLSDATIYNETKGWKLCRLGDTLILGMPDDTKASGFSKVLHIPWTRVNEAVVRDVDTSRPAAGYRKLIQVGVDPGKP